MASRRELHSARREAKVAEPIAVPSTALRQLSWLQTIALAARGPAKDA